MDKEIIINTHKKVGLALGSGGVRGLAHIGVIRTLLQHHIPINCISGSSIGAWIGAHYSLYTDIKKTEEYTTGKKKEKLYSFLEPTISGGLVKGQKIELMLDQWLDGSSFDDLKIPLKVAATDFLNGSKVSFDQGKLSTILHASMAVPGIFKPVIIDDKVLIDGGVSNPVPVDLAQELGADIVIAVNLDYYAGFNKISQKSISYGNVADGAVRIMRHYLALSACQNADFIIQPDLQRFSSWTSYFSKNNNNDEIIRLAAEETEKIIPALKDLLQDE